jgi:tocopherol O-methyltransferase
MVTTISDTDTAVTVYYAAKTPDILARYGPGPRVHYHVGPVTPLPAGEPLVPADATAEEVRTRLVAAQNDLLTETAAAWLRAGARPATVLDVGAGLGGTSLYWAAEHDVHVTALTNVAEHVPLIDRFAGQAGVTDRVTAVLGDAADPDGWAGEGRWDAAVAVDSACYTHRGRLFRSMAHVVAPGGWFAVVDHFPQDHGVTTVLDGYYKTRLGGMAEYVNSAAMTGWRLVDTLDFTAGVAGFWALSAAWAGLVLDAGGQDEQQRARLEQTQSRDDSFAAVWRGRRVETAGLLFERATGGVL